MQPPPYICDDCMIISDPKNNDGWGTFVLKVLNRLFLMRGINENINFLLEIVGL